MYGVDLGEPGLLKRRSWRWLRVRLQGLLLSPTTRVSRFFAPPPDPRRAESSR